VSADSAERLVDDGSDRLVPQRAGPVPGALDHGVEFLIGECLRGAVYLFEARARAQQQGSTSCASVWRSASGEGLNLRDE
jgi:hypothetical protein